MWVMSLVTVLLSAAVMISTLLDGYMVAGTQIFGFKHLGDNPIYFGAMLWLGLACAIIFNLFSTQLESWAKKLKRPMIMTREKTR